MSLKKSIGISEQSCQAYFNRENCSKRGGSFSNSCNVMSNISNLSSQQLCLPIGQTQSQTLKSAGRISLSPAILQKQLKDLPTTLKHNSIQNISRNKENNDQNIKPFKLLGPQLLHPQEESQSQSSSVISNSSKTIDFKLSSKLHRQQIQHPQSQSKCHTQTDSVTLPSTRLRKSSAASKSLSNCTLKSYSRTSKSQIDSTEPQTEYSLTLCRSTQRDDYHPHKEVIDSLQCYSEQQSQQFQMSTHKHNKFSLSSAQEIHKSPNNQGSCRYKHLDQQKQHSYDDNGQDEELNHGSFSNETISASQVMLSTEACSIPRSSTDQQSSGGKRLTTLNDEEPKITPFQVIPCKYHVGKKGKYLAKLNNMKSFAVCSKCAIDLASRGIIIEKAQQDSIQSEMSREIQELLAELSSRKNAEEEQWQQLKLRKEQLSQFCREQVQQIEERFLSAENTLINSKNKAINQIRTMKENIEEGLEQKEQIAREWLDESARIQCEMLVHYNQILNSIELNSFKAIIQNYQSKAQSAQAYFEDLSVQQMNLQQLNPNQEINQACCLAIETLFSMDQIQQPVVDIQQNINKKVNSNIINGTIDRLKNGSSQQFNHNIDNSSTCPRIMPPQEYHENQLPFSSTESLSLQAINNHHNNHNTNKGITTYQCNEFSSPDNLTKIKSFNQQYQNTKPPLSNSSSKIKRNCLNDTPMVKSTQLSSQITEQFNQPHVGNLSHGDQTILNWRICELPQSQESEGVTKENNELFRDQMQIKSKTLGTQHTRPQSFRTLFQEEPRLISQSQNEGVAQLNYQQNCNIQKIQMQQQFNQSKRFSDQLNQHTPNLSKSFSQAIEQPQQLKSQMISQETPISNRQHLNVKYQSIIDKIHANQTKNSTFYSELLNKPIKMDCQVIPINTILQSDEERKILPLKSTKDSIINLESGQEQQQVNSTQTNKTGQFAQFIAAHFGNNSKIYPRNLTKINTNQNMSNNIGQHVQDIHINHFDNNHNISNESIENDQIFYASSLQQSSNGSYKKTLFQSPQFRQDCEDLEEDEKQQQHQGEDQYRQIQEQTNIETQIKESPRSIQADQPEIYKGNDNDNINLRMANLFQLSFNPTYVDDSLIED